MICIAQVVTDRPVAIIIDYELDIKLRHFTAEEVTPVSNKTKTAGLDDVPPEHSTRFMQCSVGLQSEPRRQMAASFFPLEGDI